MVFSAAFGGTTSGTTVPREPYAPTKHAEDESGHAPAIPEAALQAADKHDWVAYTLANTPWVGLAGLAAGAHEAYLNFERMPPSVSRNHLSQAKFLFGIIGKKAGFASVLGAAFFATDALVEQYRGKRDMTSGMVAGAVAGSIFALGRPMPQPIAWPLAFAATAVAADLAGEFAPKYFKDYRIYGPVKDRANWGDPMPPRPPILETGASVQPVSPGQFWRGY